MATARDEEWAGYYFKKLLDAAETPEERATIHRQIDEAFSDPQAMARFAEIATEGRFQSGPWGLRGAVPALGAMALAPVIAGTGPVTVPLAALGALGFAGLGAANVKEGLERHELGLPGGLYQAGFGALEGIPIARGVGSATRGVRNLLRRLGSRGDAAPIASAVDDIPVSQYPEDSFGHMALGPLPGPRPATGASGQALVVRPPVSETQWDPVKQQFTVPGPPAREGRRASVARRARERGVHPEQLNVWRQLPESTGASNLGQASGQRRLGAPVPLPPSRQLTAGTPPLRTPGGGLPLPGVVNQAERRGRNVAAKARELGVEPSDRESIPHLLRRMRGTPGSGRILSRQAPLIDDATRQASGPHVMGPGYGTSTPPTGTPLPESARRVVPTDPMTGRPVLVLRGRRATTPAGQERLQQDLARQQAATGTGGAPGTPSAPVTPVAAAPPAAAAPSASPPSAAAAPRAPTPGSGVATATSTPLNVAFEQLREPLRAVKVAPGVERGRIIEVDGELAALDWLEGSLAKFRGKDPLTAQQIAAQVVGTPQARRTFARADVGVTGGSQTRWNPFEVGSTYRMQRGGRRGPKFTETTKISNERKVIEDFLASAKGESLAAQRELLGGKQMADTIRRQIGTTYKTAKGADREIGMSRLGITVGPDGRLKVPSKKGNPAAYKRYILAKAGIVQRNRTQATLNLLEKMGLLTGDAGPTAQILKDLLHESWVRAHHGVGTTGFRLEGETAKGLHRPMVKSMVDFINESQSIMQAFAMLFAGVITGAELMELQELDLGGLNGTVG